jgi:tetratricopeptide (TPR) repeat protein
MLSIRTLFVTLSFLICSPVVIAQTQKIERLIDSVYLKEGEDRYRFFSNRVSIINNKYLDTVQYFAKQALIHSQESNNEYVKGLSHAFFTNYYLCVGELDKALKSSKQAIPILTKYRDSINLSRIYNERGMIYSSLSDYETASVSLEKSITLLGNNPDKRLLFNYKMNIANIQEVFEKSKSIKIYSELFEILDSTDYVELGILHGAMASIFTYQDKKDSAQMHFILAIQNQIKSEDLVSLGTTYNALSFFHQQYENYDSSLIYADKAIELGEKLNDGSLVVNSLFKKTAALSKLDRLGEAFVAIDKAEKMTIKMGLKVFDEAIFFEKSRLNYEAKNYKEAYDNLANFINKYGSTRQEKTAQQILALSTKYETREKEIEINNLNKEKRIQQILYNRTLIAGIIIALLLLITLYYFILKRKKDKLIAVQQQNILTLELEEEKYLKEKLKGEILFKEQQLLSKSLQLSEKTKFINELNQVVDTMKLTLSEEEAKKLHQFKRRIKLNQNVEKDWEEFRNYFDQVHPNFFKLLNKHCSELSQAEKKLATLIQLNLDTRDCSNILHISPDSVKTARHRLKKKLNLKGEHSLDHFIQNITVPSKISSMEQFD